jgi:hypothetical protein
VRTTILDGSSLRGRWETFMSSNVFSSSQSSTGTTRKLKGVVTSSAMIESLPTPTKTKKVAEVI